MRGFVYLIGSPTFGWYKIGKANRPDVRVENLGVLLPFRVEVLAVWKAEHSLGFERQLHDRFSAQRINGEWFKFSPQVIASLVNDADLIFNRVFPNGNLRLERFSNLERDCQEGKRLVVRTKKDYGYTVAQQEIKKRHSMLSRRLKKLRIRVANLKSAISIPAPAGALTGATGE